MIRRAVALLALSGLLLSWAAPLCAANPSKSGHCCCGASAPKKAPAPRGTCCREALPNPAKAAAAAPLVVAALDGGALPSIARSGGPVAAAASPRPPDSSPPARTGLSPPRGA
jgi:hypothetical protein